MPCPLQSATTRQVQPSFFSNQFLDRIDLLKKLIDSLVQSILGFFGDFGLDEVATKLTAA